MLAIMNTDTKFDRLNPTRDNEIVQAWASGGPFTVYVTRSVTNRLRAIGCSGRPRDAVRGYLPIRSALPHGRYMGTESVEAVYVFPGEGAEPEYHGPEVTGRITLPLWVAK